MTERNRAIQMNAGASTAHGDILWFVHVDAEIPSELFGGDRAHHG